MSFNMFKDQMVKLHKKYKEDISEITQDVQYNFIPIQQYWCVKAEKDRLEAENDRLEAENVRLERENVRLRTQYEDAPGVERDGSKTCTICTRRPACRYCQKIVCSDSMDHNGRTINTIQNVTCESEDLIYCIKCTNCGKAYVGETGKKIRDRFEEHFRKIRNGDGPEGSIYHHFSCTPCKEGDGNLGNVQIYVLNICRPRELKCPTVTEVRRCREKGWIHCLKTIEPDGLNLRSGTPLVDANTQFISNLSIQ